ncbi:ABC transporter ATP-binding protein [Nocardia aurantiaca]|uniref:ATP-binding cassette domain-containing protein n=1 Tax=Nocardia aurantiaca TaxID=2675850 RepID=A0A6I3L0R3_9NOCA|nr:ABC transporter ATP-binding protein [Nocardia aurantiaca]MTE14285.1 ATP-binding cassette domain-containing protein [Nocardia aurantiaca]
MGVIEAHAVSKRYRGTLALDRLELDIPAGQIYGFLGPNGAGKTTTIRLLLGLHRPTQGTVRIAGRDAWTEPVAAHRHCAYVASEAMLWPALTGAETFEYLENLRGGCDRDYRDVLIERFDFDPHKKVRALSKGNRQKVQLVAAFATRAEILILDEPTSGLDPLMEAAFRETVGEARERGQTVFLSSHILSEVEALCDRIGILRAGRLIDEGTLAQLRHLSARTVEVNFAESGVDIAALRALGGVEVADYSDHHAVLQIRGSMGPLLSALTRLPVTTIDSREPSLEEIFLIHYHGRDDRGPSRTDAMPEGAALPGPSR